MTDQKVIDRIKKNCPIPFDSYMEHALYHPEDGYFQGMSLRSVTTGDFLTSPEVSPLFGEVLAEIVRRTTYANALSPTMVVDVGAGSGSLLAPLLSTLGESVAPWAVEVSPPAQKAAARIVGARRVVSHLEGLPQKIRGVIFANELLDNLPMAIARRRGRGWRELWVGADGDGLAWVEAPVRPEVKDWLDRFSGPTPDGGKVEVQLQACQWVRDALSRLEAGALVIIDYGNTAGQLAHRRVEGTLRTYRAHHLGPDPLAEPGQTDITADVNFTAIMETAQEAGASVSLHRQDDFLEDLGLRERIEGLRREELEHARSGDEMRRLKVRSLRTGAEMLLHPRGLGDFRVLIARKSL